MDTVDSQNIMRIYRPLCQSFPGMHIIAIENKKMFSVWYEIFTGKIVFPIYIHFSGTSNKTADLNIPVNF